MIQKIEFFGATLYCKSLISVMSVRFSNGLIEFGEFVIPCSQETYDGMFADQKIPADPMSLVTTVIAKDRSIKKLEDHRVNFIVHVQNGLGLGLDKNDDVFHLPCSRRTYRALQDILSSMKDRAAPWHEFAFVIDQYSHGGDDCVFDLDLYNSDAVNRFLCTYASCQFPSVLVCTVEIGRPYLSMFASRDDMCQFKQVCQDAKVVLLNNDIWFPAINGSTAVTNLSFVPEAFRTAILANPCPSAKKYECNDQSVHLDLSKHKNLLQAVFQNTKIAVKKGELVWA